MSFFNELTIDLRTMLDVRSSLGYATATDESTLPPFIDYCGNNYPGATSITKEMIDGWLAYYPFKCSRAQAVFISLVRHYTRFIRSLGKEAFIPDEDYTIRYERYRPYIAFQKAYKRNHSRQRVGKMSQNEFYEWSEEARLKRGECEAGRLTLDEFKAWLGNKR